jgi:hypothetical protein
MLNGTFPGEKSENDKTVEGNQTKCIMHDLIQKPHQSINSFKNK